MTIDSITTLTTMVGWTVVRASSRAVLSLTHWVFVVLAWLALGFVGGVMLLRWTWRPIQRSAVALVRVVMSRSFDSSLRRARRR